MNEQLGRKVESVQPEAVVILGNDQREFFNPGLTPAITVYRGAEIHNVQHMTEGQPGLNIALPGPKRSRVLTSGAGVVAG